jgi:hypothetical protein
MNHHGLGILVLVLALDICLVVGNDFDPTTVRLLACKFASVRDPHKVNCLYRSNIPSTQGVFDYTQLTSTMKSAAQNSGVILSDENLYIVDISLLHSDDSDLKTEQDYFSTNPEHGLVINYPLYGTPQDPSIYTTEEVIKQSKNLDWMQDDIESLLELIDRYLSDFSGRNLNILLHCQHGYVFSSMNCFF